jgi:hypothetical protein
LTIFHKQYNSAEYSLYTLFINNAPKNLREIITYIAGTYVFAGNVAAANRRVSASAIAIVLLKGNYF